MVASPIIANRNTDLLKQSSILHTIGAAIFADIFEGRKDAFFLDVENGTPAISAFAFRLANSTNDTVNYFTGQELQPTPTVDEIIANPNQMFNRLMFGTNVDINRAIAEAPQQENEIRAGAQRRMDQGAAFAQVIASAVNADKDTRNAFDAFLRSARDNALRIVDQERQRARGVSDSFFERLIDGFADFVIEGVFARPRRSGDNKRVSKEIHEYNYLSQEKITSYGTNILGQSDPSGFTHLEVAMLLLNLNFMRPHTGFPGIGQGSEVPDAEELEEILDGNFFSPGPEVTDASLFSYGNFIDSYHMRKLLAELKKLVQGTRVDNVTGFLRRSGTSREEFLDNTLHRLAPNGFISNAANELLVNTFGNPTRPVRDAIDSTDWAQPFLGEGENQGRVEEGPLLRFSAPQPTPSPSPNLEPEGESEN